VELKLHGAAVESSYADGQGRFGFYNLAANPYHVVINDDDYYPVDELANVNPAVSPYAMVQILLQPREDKKKDDPAGGRAAGSNPYLIDPADYNKRFPKKAVKEYERGVNAERKGKHDEAIAFYESALKIAPDYYPAHNNLGSIYLSKSDFPSAEAQFQEAARLDQNDAQAYFNLGNVFMLTGRYGESQSAIETGMKRRPDSGFGHFLQGCLFARIGNFDQAERDLRDALRLEPAMSQAYLQLVNLYMKQGRKPDAIAELEAYLKAFPDAPFSTKARDLLKRLQGEVAGNLQ
jgi:tetratricopeptide (TPR) repeat protein